MPEYKIKVSITAYEEGASGHLVIREGRIAGLGEGGDRELLYVLGNQLLSRSVDRIVQASYLEE